MVLGHLDGQARGRRRARAGGKLALNDAVFERLVGEHDDAAPDGERVERRRQGGLKGGEKVIVSNPQKVQPGSPVRVAPAKAPAAPAQPKAQ